MTGPLRRLPLVGDRPSAKVKQKQKPPNKAKPMKVCSLRVPPVGRPRGFKNSRKGNPLPGLFPASVQAHPSMRICCPARFARYTSRTPYAGIRTREKDSVKLKAFDEFYVEIERRARGATCDEQRQAQALLHELRVRGKWPAKPDLLTWFGDKGTEWQDRHTGAFRRAVTRPDDVELLTRHEAQVAPPDLLVTNYSMLEYMLMRPIERPIFDQTREWLASNADETFLIVLDEAHLYRGAAGAEVGLLLRRLRDRLCIPPERLQVICATASFRDANYAPLFGAQLTGVPARTFVPVQGDFAWRPHAARGSKRDAEVLASIDLTAFYSCEHEAARAAIVLPFLEYRHVPETGSLETRLYHALADFPPLGLLINSTMKQALPVEELGRDLFPTHPTRPTLPLPSLWL